MDNKFGYLFDNSIGTAETVIISLSIFLTSSLNEGHGFIKYSGFFLKKCKHFYHFEHLKLPNSTTLSTTLSGLVSFVFSLSSIYV